MCNQPCAAREELAEIKQRGQALKGTKHCNYNDLVDAYHAMERDRDQANDTLANICHLRDAKIFAGLKKDIEILTVVNNLLRAQLGHTSERLKAAEDFEGRVEKILP